MNNLKNPKRLVYNERVKDEASLMSAMESMVDPVLNEPSSSEENLNEKNNLNNNGEEEIEINEESISEEAEESNGESVQGDADERLQAEKDDDEEDDEEEINKSIDSEEVVEDLYSDFEDSDDSDTGDAVEEIDVSSISKDLGFDANDIESLKEQINNKIEESKISADEWKNGVPQNLIEAVELSKGGGDYLDYLNVSSIDYSSIPDIDIVASALYPDFTKDGVVDEDALNEYVDTLTDTQIRVEASKLRRNYEANQEHSKNEKIALANQRRQDVKEGIEKALSSYDDVGGFKVPLSEKNFIRNSVNNDTLMKDLFFNSKGVLDYEKVRDVVFKYRNFDKIKRFWETKFVNQTKRDVISKMSNIERRNSSSPSKASPEDKTSPVYQQKTWMKSLKG